MSTACRFLTPKPSNICTRQGWETSLSSHLISCCTQLCNRQRIYDPETSAGRYLVATTFPALNKQNKLQKREKKKALEGGRPTRELLWACCPSADSGGERSRGPQLQRAARQLAWFTIHMGRREPRASRIVPFTVLNCQQKACASVGPCRKAAPAAPAACTQPGVKPSSARAAAASPSPGAGVI